MKLLRQKQIEKLQTKKNNYKQRNKFNELQKIILIFHYSRMSKIK